MAIYLLTFIVCLVVCGFTIAALLLSRTPRYRTEAKDMLTLLDGVLARQINENQWNMVIGYPIRHDPYLENIRRRCQHIMEEYGTPWMYERNKKLLSDQGLEELAAIRDHLAARQALKARS
ncbi:hypothetical protein [Phytohalomonas tamaricis]|uniref:hypothetical protein n=1 Tax=Phytohalomonas tamaricis TaxID=2081032 RepID=UPI000D0B7D84|nr:hypothetical protein [Phytohalomonas tamaricis]